MDEAIRIPEYLNRMMERIFSKDTVGRNVSRRTAHDESGYTDTCTTPAARQGGINYF